MVIRVQGFRVYFIEALKQATGVAAVFTAYMKASVLSIALLAGDTILCKQLQRIRGAAATGLQQCR